MEGILGENDGELLKQFTFCALHIQMRIVEWIGNRTLADAKATFKDSKRKQVSDAIKEWNRKMQQELHQKSGMTIFDLRHWRVYLSAQWTEPARLILSTISKSWRIATSPS